LDPKKRKRKNKKRVGIHMSWGWEHVFLMIKIKQKNQTQKSPVSLLYFPLFFFSHTHYCAKSAKCHHLLVAYQSLHQSTTDQHCIAAAISAIPLLPGSHNRGNRVAKAATFCHCLSLSHHQQQKKYVHFR